MTDLQFNVLLFLFALYAFDTSNKTKGLWAIVVFVEVVILGILLVARYTGGY